MLATTHWCNRFQCLPDLKTRNINNDIRNSNQHYSSFDHKIEQR